MIDRDGNVIVPPMYAYVGGFSEGYAAVETKSGEHGFVNARGEFRLIPGAMALGEFHDGFAAIDIGGKLGVLDNKFRIIIQPRYFDLRAFSEGLAAAETQDAKSKRNYFTFITRKAGRHFRRNLSSPRTFRKASQR